MATQSGNVLDTELRDKVREEFQGVEERLRDTVGDVVEYIAEPVQEAYHEVIVDQPVLKAFILGQLSMSVLFLIVYLLLRG